jgi:hypothetical protein
MSEDASDQPGHGKEQHGNSAGSIKEDALFSYYRDDREDTGGMKVKWTIRVATGTEAERLDDRQNHAIRELLQWAAHRQTPG